MKKLTKDEILKRFESVHGNLYDYSLMNYKNTTTKIKIICPEHGIFEQKPREHLYDKSGCQKCKNKYYNTSLNDLITLGNKTHNNKYDYSLSEFIKTKDKTIIICPEHGQFRQSFYNHIDRKNGCPSCQKLTTNIFIKKATIAHNNKYDYSEVVYNLKSKIKIICPAHGKFIQSPSSHLEGVGCKKCSDAAKTSSLIEFVKKANDVHNNKYDYTESKYKNATTKIKIICPDHGYYYQLPKAHLNQGNGCPKCKMSKGEIIISNFLEEHEIEFVSEKRFKDCKSLNILPFDFYLPLYNICIEYDGIQHFEEVAFFGGKDALIKTKEHDKIKTIYCKNKNIKLIRISYRDKILKILEGFDFG